MTLKCNCGSEEYITEANAYDIYQYDGDNFNFQRTERIDSEFKLYCRDCGVEITLPPESDNKNSTNSAVKI
ncbi:MAG: hypothetical protein K0U19_01790 [Proteobacteria bacterium]|nr:hypothetical protein [Pseudomonadota bacterium]